MKFVGEFHRFSYLVRARQRRSNPIPESRPRASEINPGSGSGGEDGSGRLKEGRLNRDSTGAQGGVVLRVCACQRLS